MLKYSEIETNMQNLSKTQQEYLYINFADQIPGYLISIKITV